MFPYLFLSIPIALLALVTPLRKVQWLLWSVAFIALVAFVGLRHHVGMDWNNYLLMIGNVTLGPLDEALRMAEPAYALLLRTSGQLGLGVYGANLVVALILMAGLFRYALTTPSPWLAILSSIPFLVVVTAMSANRQAAAIGVLLWAIAGWPRYSVVARVLMVLLAASFHASAIVFLILVVADLNVNRKLKVAAVLLLAAGAGYFLALTDKFDYYDQAYGSGQGEITQSSGAIFHVLINGGPALLYLAMRRYRDVLLPNAIHRRMALIAVALIPLALFASAAAGRLSLYLFPVSMYVVAALPLVLKGRGTNLVYKLVCALFFVSLLSFWLLVSNTGYAYLPYRNLLETPPSERELCC